VQIILFKENIIRQFYSKPKIVLWACHTIQPSSFIYLHTCTDGLVKKSVTSMEPEQIRFGWIMSCALDRKAHWLTALTTVGVYTTAITPRMSQSNVMLWRQLHPQTVSILGVC